MTLGDYTLLLVVVVLPLVMVVAFIAGAVFQRRQDERDACAHDCGHYEHTSGDDTKFVWGKMMMMERKSIRTLSDELEREENK